MNKNKNGIRDDRAFNSGIRDNFLGGKGIYSFSLTGNGIFLKTDSGCGLKNRKSLAIDVIWKTATLTKQDPGMTILIGAGWRDQGLKWRRDAGLKALRLKCL